MQINPDSWHWKLAMRYNYMLQYDRLISLCTYFWLTLWYLLRAFAEDVLWSKMVRPVIIGVAIFYFYVVPMYIAIAHLNMGFDNLRELQKAGIATLIQVLWLFGFSCLIVTIVAGVLFVVYLILCLVERADPNRIEEKVVNVTRKIADAETYKLVSEFVKAKKRKVCPLLEIPKSS
ncbi:MAG: hypothetical protein Q8P76_00190 [bacterium]|nr:hypothetical protein [bacterium]